MIGRINLGICAVALALMPAAALASDRGPSAVDPHRAAKAGDGEIHGTVTRVDETHRVIILDDQRAFRLTEDGAVLVDSRPVQLTTIQPGTVVVIHAAEPVTFVDGRYVAAAGDGPRAVNPGRAIKASSSGEIRGKVARIDEAHRVVVFDDQRAFRLTEDGAILVEGRPVALDTLQPGREVVIRAGEPVMYRHGQYVVIRESTMRPAGSSVAVVTPGAPTTTVTTITSPAEPTLVSGQVDGRVARIDADQGVVVFDDGRMFLLGPKAVVLAGGEPVQFSTLAPGMRVTLVEVNPVVYVNGRYVVLNEGFHDGGSASPMTGDAKFEGFDAITDNAAMDIQVGGGGAGS
jgi:hypothetical protein